MSVGFFIFTVVLIVLLCGMLYFLKWALHNVEFSEKPKVQRRYEIGLKVLMIIFGACLSYIAFETTIVLVAPLIDHLNTAFSVAVSKVLSFLDQVVPWAVLIGIGVAWWKSTHPKQDTTPAAVNDVDIELARQRAIDMQGYALGLMLQVLIAISSFTPVIRPRNTHDIEVRSTDGASFYMKDNIVIYQAEAEIEGEITPEVEDTIQREAQRYAQKYITDYSMLISPEAGGRAPVEVLGVKNCGSRVLIDFVFTTTKAIPIIDARRRARVERQMKQERPTPYTDPDYGE